MADFQAFRSKIREYYQQVLSPKGVRYTQADLAASIYISTSDLSRRLNRNGSTLTYPLIRRIVKTLAEWGAITTVNEAVELLDLVECPHFSEAEWISFPLDQLQPSRITTDSDIKDIVNNTRSISKNISLATIPVVGKDSLRRYKIGTNIVQMSWSPDGHYLAVSDAENNIYIIPSIP